MARDRVDDPTEALVPHEGQRGRGRADGGTQVDAEVEVERLVVDVLDQAGPADPGVVDDHVDAGPRFTRPLDQAGATGNGGEVGRGGDRLATPVLDLPGRGVGEIGVDVVDEHRGPLGRQGQGVGAAEPLPGAGHDRHLPLERSHERYLSTS